MTIQLDWDNDEHTVIRCMFERTWTWDQMYSALSEIKKVTDAAPHPIAAIIDLRSGATLPGGSIFAPSTLEHARKMLKMGEGESAPVVVVGASPLIRTAYSTLRSLDKNGLSNVQFASTLGEARAHLMRHDYHYPETPPEQ